MIISFNRDRVQNVLSRVHGAGGVKFSSGPLDKHTLRIGLRLVGGYGVYLVPDTPEAVNDPTYWVFAYEANPKIMEEDALQLATEKVFGNAEGGDDSLSPELVNQWICRSILDAIRMDVTPLSLRLIFDYDIDFKTDHLLFHGGVVDRGAINNEFEGV